MSKLDPKNKSVLLTALIVPAVLALLGGLITLVTTDKPPWWFNQPSTDSVEADNTKKPDESITEILTPDNESETENPSPISSEKSPQKIDVASAWASTEYSAGYSASKLIDANTNSYWSTQLGQILDVNLKFVFEKPQSISAMSIYAPDRSSSYAQPLEVTLVFSNDSGVINRQTLALKGKSSKWEKYELDKAVNSVTDIEIEIVELTNDTANYITLSEVRFLGY